MNNKSTIRTCGKRVNWQKSFAFEECGALLLEYRRRRVKSEHNQGAVPLERFSQMTAAQTEPEQGSGDAVAAGTGPSSGTDTEKGAIQSIDRAGQILSLFDQDTLNLSVAIVS